MRNFNWAKAGIFTGGFLFGLVGIKLLGSKDAKKAYSHAVAAGMRAKDSVMKAATTVQENAEDIVAEAKEINRKRAERVCEEVVCEETSCEETPCEEQA